MPLSTLSPESRERNALSSAAELRYSKFSRKLIHIGLLTTFLLLTTLQCLLATDVKAQNAEQVNITLSTNNDDILSAIHKIEELTVFRFVYRNEELQNVKVGDIPAAPRTLKETLDLLFRNTGLTYTQLDQKIMVAAKDVTASQDLSVAGMVTDESGVPFPGVSVRLKGNNKYSTATDVNGHFNLNYPATKNATLIFSYTGYTSREMVIGTQNSLRLSMSPDAGSLNEVQIIGYGTTTRKTSTGSLASITAREIGQQPVGNPLAALAGRLSGVLIAQNNGVPGGAVQIQIRGQNTLQSGGIPLYVIDGVPFTNFNGGSPATDNLNAFGTSGASGGLSPFSMINPSDIERIDVLKDADATSIYGSRGANGVVLITTKKGKSGKVKVNVNLNTGFTEVNRKIPMMNLEQYLAMRREAFANDGVTPNTSNAPDLTVWDQTKSTDFQKLLFGNKGYVNEAQMSLSGGNDQTRFFFNSGYRRESTVYQGNNASRRFSNRLNLDHTSANRKFAIALSVSYTNDNTTVPTTDVTSAYNLPPNLPLYDDQGKLFWSTNFNNPLASLLKTYSGVTNNLISNANLRYTIIEGLNAKVNFGYTSNRLDQIAKNPASSQNPAANPNSLADFTNGNAQNWIIEPTLDYSKNIGGGKLTALIGTSYQQNSSNTLFLRGTNYSNEALLGTLTAAGTVTVSYHNIVKYKYDAIFGRLNYEWKDKYLINATYRRDGSSRFGPQNRFGNFAALGAGWIFSNEDFVKNSLPFLSFGKLRGSFGNTGNDQIANYIYLPLYSAASTYLGNAAMNLVSLPNEGIKWESTKKLDLALELGFLRDRIYLTANYYRNRSSNLITSNALPTQSGFNSYVTNLPAVIQNKGIELELNTTNVIAGDFSWKSALNVSFTNNKLLDFPNLASSFYASSYVVGEPVNVIRLYHYLGVNPANGTATYEDRDGNGIINADDRYVADIGTPYYGGFNNSFTYKGFELGVFFQFNHRFGVTNIVSTRPGALTNQNEYWLGRWTPENTGSTIPGSSATAGTPVSASYNNYTNSDAVYGDASYLKLRSVNLSYNLPSKWLKPARLSACNVFVQGQNLFTWAKNKYTLDTETTIQGGPSGLGTGTLGQVLPPLRTIVFGLNCTF
ncbi:SusC/RagA family TonB-linked outer membrane protein [Pedobacter sp. MC2016-15]|uniref:SusC/RagA family TonB-linked outer membrane protein n=1 Tax=Pedobacter sp. MC2016-15 TaxID=2994473 RepID=UPI0022485AA7|nr:SusC/RagA family TonB-linked outer membrane protein [Pedobacter sp. MC2016-15]MCX2479377.1 SusC/RagA family TonB-linked outer membrane protein [Pedobacter sp. MC2016-15]